MAAPATDVEDCRNPHNYWSDPIWSQQRAGAHMHRDGATISVIGKLFYDDLEILLRFHLLLYSHMKGRQ